VNLTSLVICQLDRLLPSSLSLSSADSVLPIHLSYLWAEDGVTLKGQSWHSSESVLL
jgi:hypothetical protein